MVTAFSVGVPSLWNALPQHLTLTAMTTTTFKVKPSTYIFSELFIQRCEHRLLEQRYTNVSIMIMITICLTKQLHFKQVVISQAIAKVCRKYE